MAVNVHPVGRWQLPSHPADGQGTVLKETWHSPSLSLSLHSRSGAVTPAAMRFFLLNVIMLSHPVLALKIQAAKFQWRPDATRIIYHVLDAPSHGKQFHPPDTSWDCTVDLPHRDEPEKEIRLALESLINQSKINRYIFHIRNCDCIH